MSEFPVDQKRQIIAAFDFDGTLTRTDSFLPFLKMLVGPVRLWLGLLYLAPILIPYLLKLVPNWRAKEAVLQHFLKGRSPQEIAQLGETYAHQGLPSLLRPEAMQRLAWHQQQGHSIVLVSASPEIYLRPWAKSQGIDLACGTHLELSGDRLTGRLRGKNCYGQEKVKRLQSVVGPLDQYVVYAYGDSEGDRELLAQANFPYYQTFADPIKSTTQEGSSKKESPKSGVPNWERGLIFSVTAAAAFYLALVLWSGATDFISAITALPVWLIPLLLAIVFFGYCLRFGRWQWYLHTMGYSVPPGSSFRIFLASFALTASPGKAGESVKSLFLKRRHQVPVAPTLAGLFCERFTDALSVVLLAGLGLSSTFQGQWLIILVGALQVLVILVLQRPQLIQALVLKPLSRWPKLQAIAQKIEALVESASILLKPKVLIGGTGLAFLAWGLEGVVLYLIFQALGVGSITIYQSVLIHTAAGLLGALTFLPGGIGGTEVITIGLSLFYGASQTAAVTATFLIRLMTLWFAVGIGLVAILLLPKK